MDFIEALRAPGVETMSNQFKEMQATVVSSDGSEEESSSGRKRDSGLLDAIDSLQSEKSGLIRELKIPSLTDSSLLKDKENDNRSPLTAVN